jgi:hypothetical protein
MTKDEAKTLKRCRRRVWEAEGAALGIELIDWSSSGTLREIVQAVYDDDDIIEGLGISSTRLANLFEPLQAVLLVEEQMGALDLLEAYANGLDKTSREAESRSDGVRLLAAFLDLFKSKGENWEWVSTEGTVIPYLMERGEGWEEYSYGKPISSRKVALLLKEYDIKPDMNKSRTGHGYYRRSFEDAWERYLHCPPPTGCNEPSNPSKPSNPSMATEKGGAL